MRTFILSLLLFSALFSFAQPFSVGVFGGISGYQGDLTNKAFNSKTIKPGGGITVNYDISSRVTLRAGLAIAAVSGNDKYNAESAKNRNLNFTSGLTEGSLLGEFNVFSLDAIRWTPYVFGGIAVYHFNPYTTNSEGTKTFLQPLSTEGQGLEGYSAKPYSLTQFALPFGGGVKYAISDKVRVGLELGMRKLFTDYLDDVSTNYADESDLFLAKGPTAVELSYRTDELEGGNLTYPSKGQQRGGAKQNDWYYFTGLHLTFRLGGEGGGRNKYGVGCPTGF